MKRVIIIDYKVGNLFSVKQACDSVGIKSKISSDLKEINSADGLILPGVGAFNEAMKNLNDLGISSVLKKRVGDKIPLFGVCLGLQLLFTESEEFGTGLGLDFIPGTIKKFPNSFKGNKMKVPHVAWNTISRKNIEWEKTPFSNLTNDQYMYFVHSFYVDPSENSCVLSETNYNGKFFCSSLLVNNIFATQFHPEKSGEKGLKIYKNWAKINNLI
tara:strand:+ start:59 stop:703 length:645 start_codon:yes stop_codon:yes gene_type:complete